MENDRFKVIAGIDAHAYTHHVALIADYGKHLRPLHSGVIPPVT